MPRPHFLPHYCELCDRRFDGRIDLCALCRDALPYRQPGCRVCASTLLGGVCPYCEQQGPSFFATLAPFHYRDAVAHWVHAMKFNKGLRQAHLLAHLMADYLVTRLPLQPDIIVPMPLHWRRQFVRGHNQACLLAAPIARRLRIPLNAKLLKRVRYTKPQARLAKSARAVNVRAVFRARPLNGEHIALVDDVATTGNTIEQASRALRRAGAGSVQVWVAARA